MYRNRIVRRYPSTYFRGYVFAGDDMACNCEIKKTNSRVFVYSLYTEEKYRRQGCATRLLNYIMSYFKNCDMILQVYETNHEARALYDKLGFVELDYQLDQYGEKVFKLLKLA